MRIFWIALGVFVALLAAAWLIANNKFTKRMAQAETVWANIAATAKPAALTYSPELVADLPEIAQRYFNHSIAVGTPLSTTVELQMYGEFRLGEKDNYKRFDMQARQILSPPNEFVWIADMKSGPVRVNGSDSFSQGQGWVRFWMFRAIPLVQATGNPDLDRAGAARPLVEAVWVPASLLPQNGAQWEQLDMTRAKVSFGSENAQQEMILTINQQGRPVSVTTQRWSDVNPEKTYQYTSFGGTMQEETQFGGFTIPSLVHVGYHFGSDNYFPFFIGNISDAKFY